MPDRAPRLAVLGWSDSVEQLLPQLCSLLGFSIVGVGDRSAAALIRARRSTNAPYFQHTAEMIRRLEYDVLLVADTDAAIELVPRAASRGAHLIGEASSLSASALDAVATAAVRRGVPLALARPLLRRPAVEAALQLVRDDARWRPSLVTIELGGPRAEEQQLRDAVALATRLVPEPPHQVTAAAAPSARHVAAQLRYAEDALVVIGVHGDGEEQTSIRMHAEAGAATACSRAGEPDSLRTQTPGEAPAVRQFQPEYAFEREAEHIAAALSGDPTDLRLAHREAAVLGALESALHTGQTHHVSAPGIRSTLRVLAGGAHGVSAPSGHLHLIEQEAAG